MAKENGKKIKQAIKDVNSFKNHTADMITATHGVAFAFFYILEVVLDYYVYPMLPKGFWRSIIMIVIATVLYPLTYLGVKFVYNKIIDFRKPKYDIEGIWYHLHIPHNMGAEDYSRDMLRAGETVIVRDLYDFAFEGKNYDYCVDESGQVIRRGSNMTGWYTELSEISDSGEFDIIQVYKASSTVEPKMEIKSCPCCKHEFRKPVEINEASKTRYGVHKFKIHRRQGRIDGVYSDCWPSLKTGALILYRSEADRDARIKEFFETRSAMLAASKELCVK